MLALPMRRIVPKGCHGRVERVNLDCTIFDRRNSMKKFALAAIALSVSAMSAIAQQAPTTVTIQGNQTFDVNGLSLEYEATLVFSGSLPAGMVLHVDGTANATAVCLNPGGKTSKNEIPVSTPITISGTEVIKVNEKEPFFAASVSTNPPSAIPGAPDCSSDKWTEKVTGFDVTSAIVTILDPTQDILFQEVCPFNPPLTSVVPRTC
jgi:hypothetical protein